MSIPSITGPSRISTSIADAPAPAPSVRSTPSLSEVEIDEVTQQPVPPRFPWLSRLTLQLESAARQKPAFAPAPVLGDHVDKSA